MIYEKDLDESIARYQGETNPSINTCIKLAACYALKHELFGNSEQLPATVFSAENVSPAYSYADSPAGAIETIIDYHSDTEFSKAINGRKSADIWPIMDDLMAMLQLMQPRMYDSVMRELRK